MTRQTKRSARIATLCVLGDPVQTTSANRARIKLLEKAVESIQANSSWARLDALLLPGGYFWLSRPIGPLSDTARRSAVLTQAFARAVCRLVRVLHKRSPGCIIVVGTRAKPKAKGEYLEQVCLAFSARTVVGLARKIFPTLSEATGKSRTIPYARDYGSALRVVKLASGHRAILSACYDMFGLAEIAESQASERQRALRVFRTDKGLAEQGDVGFTELKAGSLSQWHQLLEVTGPTIALASIHCFDGPGRDGYWQRHGIAVASSVLKGGLAVGAAHFSYQLPKPTSSTLASADVPATHLKSGLHRKARTLQAITSLTICVDNEIVALVRLFKRPAR